ncbi:MAG: GAF domain-containing protein, partial [Chloroflexi bacterium]|nr:GAF domain-containing protein [Chloroflexota bacterium]
MVSSTRWEMVRRMQLTLAFGRWVTAAAGAAIAPFMFSGWRLIIILAAVVFASFYSALLRLAIRSPSPSRVLLYAAASTALDAVTVSTVIGVTGGFASPYFVVYFAVAISVGMQFGLMETLLFAPLLYVGGYAVATTASQGWAVWPQVYGEFGFRASFLLISSLVIRKLAEERVSLADANILLQRLNKILVTANAISRALNSPRALSESLRYVTRKVTEIPGISDCSLFLLMEGSANGGASRTSSDGRIRRIDLQDLENNYPLVAKSLKTQKPVVVSSEGSEIDLPLPSYSFKGQILTAVPLVSHDTPLGALCLFGTHSSSEFKEDEMGQILSIASQMTTTIENARLYESLQAQMEELKRAQAQLVQSAKMASVGTLAAGVAHEINNPLQVISGRVELLLAQGERYLKSDKARDYLEVVGDMTERVTKVVKGLLAFSREEQEPYHPLDVQQAIEETLALVANHLRMNHVQLVRDYASNLPEVMGSKNKLQQVFMNLILNAKDAMPQGGTLTIASQVEEGDVTLKFSDTGVGIDRENLERIFDPFFT